MLDLPQFAYQPIALCLQCLFEPVTVPIAMDDMGFVCQPIQGVQPLVLHRQKLESNRQIPDLS